MQHKPPTGQDAAANHPEAPTATIWQHIPSYLLRPTGQPLVALDGGAYTVSRDEFNVLMLAALIFERSHPYPMPAPARAQHNTNPLKEAA